MRIANFRPYSSCSNDSGLISLFTYFLRSCDAAVLNLVCDGVFSVCSRERHNNWKRSLETCFFCTAEADIWHSWIGGEKLFLSSFLNEDHLRLTKIWVDDLSTDELLTANFEGIDVSNAAIVTFEQRFNTKQVNLANQVEILFYRRLLLVSIRMWLATNNFISKYKPDLLFIGNNNDTLNKSVFNAVTSLDSKVVIINASNMDKSGVEVKLNNKTESFTFINNAKSILDVNKKISSWPSDLIKDLNSLADYLDLNINQMSLPL